MGEEQNRHKRRERLYRKREDRAQERKPQRLRNIGQEEPEHANGLVRIRTLRDAYEQSDDYPPGS